MNLKPFNPTQLDPHGFTMVEASAGTGKTFSLALSVLSLLLRRHQGGKTLSLSQILIVTFTKKATAEIRHRVAVFLKAAQKAAQRMDRGENLDPGDPIEALVAHTFAHALSLGAEGRGWYFDTLATSLFLVDQAPIFTIHSFCQQRAADLALDLNYPLGLQGAEDLDKPLDLIVRNSYRSRVMNLKPVVFGLGLFADQSFLDSVRKTCSSLLSHPALDYDRQRFDWTSALENWQALDRQLMAMAQKQWDEVDENLRRFWERVLESKQAKGKKTLYTGMMKKPFVEVGTKDFPDQVDQVPFYRWLTRARDMVLGERPYWTDPTPLNAPFKGQDSVSEYLQKIVDHNRGSFDFHPFVTTLLQWMDRGLELEGAFTASCFEDALELLGPQLERQGSMTFDLAVETLVNGLKGLRGKEIAAKISRPYEIALVDEFQDTDAAQWAIFRGAFLNQGAKGLVVVGDPKQAIYRFRGGDIETYLSAKESGPEIYNLSTNFRSSRGVIDGLNQAFSIPASPEDPVAGGFFLNPQLGYEAVSSKDPRVRNLRRWVDGAWVEGKSTIHMDPQWGKGSALTVTVQLVQGLLSGNWQLNQGSDQAPDWRDIRPDDICVLTTKNKKNKELQLLLEGCGIAASVNRGESIYRSQEAYFLLSLAEALVAPRRESSLRALQLYPWFSSQPSQMDQSPVDQGLLVRCSELWYGQSWAHCFERFARESGLYARLGSMDQGPRRLTNIRQLMGLMAQAESEIGHSPYQLLRWLSGAVGSDQDDPYTNGDTKTLGPDQMSSALGSVVSIMTIHSSKGLEFPVVISVIEENKNRFSPLVRLGGADGAHWYPMGQKMVNQGDQEGVEEALVQEGQEFRRLVYVALTRAARAAFVVQKLSQGTKTAKSWGLFQGLLLDGVYDSWEILPMDLVGTHSAAFVPSSDGQNLGTCRSFNGTIATPTKRSSFSGLTRGFAHGSNPGGQGQVSRPLDNFPRGARPGTALHEIFEKIDYRKPDSWQHTVDSTLKTHGFEGHWVDPVCEMVQRVLTKALDPLEGQRLVDVLGSDRLAEADFAMALPRLDPQEAAQGLGTYLASAWDGLQSYESALALVGQIDLVFRVGQRYYILDWKSNFLGTAPDSYGTEAMEQAMMDNRYQLQFQLYGTALIHQLQLRMGPRYDHSLHFGGVFYIFVRGIDRGGSGVYFHRPQNCELDHLLSLCTGVIP